VILIGIMWGIGKAAVYKHIPEYFPNEVGVVGGMVGLIGGLGGFIGPILFGYLLDRVMDQFMDFRISHFRYLIVLDESGY